MRKNSLGILLLVVLSSCNLRDVNYSDSEIVEMKHKIVEKSNEDSFTEYSSFLGKKDSLLYLDALAYSLSVMDNKNSKANFDFFEIFLRAKFKGIYNPNNILKLAKPEQDLLIYYLNQGHIKNDSYCSYVLIDYYDKGIYFKKNKVKADSLYFEVYGRNR
nr:hypothetical protein [uncultured Flavobacterium sp.]